MSEPHRGHHAALALAKPYGVDYTQAYRHHNHREARPISRVRHGASRRTRFRNPLDFTWISRGFRISDWISGFHVDFWISKWISGFHVDFRISKWISTFWILFEELLFDILKILLINKPSQPGCTQNTMSQALHSSPRRTAYCMRTACVLRA